LKASNLLVLGCAGALALGVSACGGGGGGAETAGGGGGAASGDIAIDGSSTVYPFAQAAAEEFQASNPEVRITVGEAGTSGGFEKFCAGETQISDASRPIDSTEEEACKKGGVGYTEILVAQDGISVVTNPDLAVECMTTDELKEVWEPDSKITSLSQINPDWPDTELSLYGPGTDSGTFDYFTDVINGEEGASRTDYQPSEDDNVLVEGVAGDPGGMGYFGFSYYEQNKDELNLVALDAGDGCVAPDTETIQNQSYVLSRPLYMYVSDEAAAEPQVAAYLQYVADNYDTVAETALIVPMSEDQAAEAQKTVEGLQ
jgi:phosphate transport system substrate-binding protein